MISKRTFLRTTISAMALTYAMLGPAYAGSGSIVYDLDYVSTFGSNLNTPIEIKQGADGNLYIADRYNHRVQVYDGAGNHITDIGSFGSGPGQFNEAFGIAFGTDGKLIVGDIGGGRVQLFDPVTYAYLGDLASVGNNPGELLSVTSVAVDSAGNIYVADQGNNRISVFAQDGTHITDFAQGDNTYALAVGPDDTIYGTNYYRSTVFAYTSYSHSGSIVSTSPLTGIATDRLGNIYVSQYANSNLVVLDKNGNVLVEYDNSASPRGSFNNMEGIVANDQGRIYVVDGGNNEVQRLLLTSNETFTSSPVGGDEIAATPLSNLLLAGSLAGDFSFSDDFIGYNEFASISNWTLSGNSSFTGEVYVGNAPFTNNGTITATNVVTTSTGTVAGNGTFNANFSNAGTVSPGTTRGDDIGTLTFNGNYTNQNGATYRVGIDASGQTDLLAISGTVTLSAGSILDINAASGSYAYDTDYVILTSGGGIIGMYDTVNSNLAFLTPTLDYSNPNVLLLTMTRNDIPPPGGGSSPLDFTPYAQGSNQQGTASALGEYSASQFGGNTDIYNAVQSLTTADAEKLVAQVTPDEIAAIPQIQFNTIRAMQMPVFQRLIAPAAPSATQSFGLFTPVSFSGLRPDQFWMQAIGGTSSQKSDTNGAVGFRAGTIGMRAGVDKDTDQDTKLGLSIGYAHGNADYKNSFDKSETQYAHIDLYGSKQLNGLTNAPVILEGMIGAGGGRVDSTRIISAGTLNLAAQGNTNAYDVSSAVKISAPKRVSATDVIIPNLTTAASWTRQNGYTESGAGPFNLNVEAMHSVPVTITPMLNWQHEIRNTEQGYAIIPEFGVGATWQVSGRDNNVDARFAGATGVPGFKVQGAQQDPVSINFTAGAVINPYEAALYVPEVSVQTTFQSSSTTANATASLTAKWIW